MATYNLGQTNKPGILHCAEATFDIGVTGALVTGANTINSGVFIPDGAVITKAWYHVATTFTGAGADAATIQLGTTSSLASFVVGIAISAAGNIWDAGVRGTLVGVPALDGLARTAIAGKAAIAGTLIHCTANEELIMTTGANTITAGKLKLYVEYVLTGDLS